MAAGWISEGGRVGLAIGLGLGWMSGTRETVSKAIAWGDERAPIPTARLGRLCVSCREDRPTSLDDFVNHPRAGRWP